jgi:hypothetical protein
MIVHTGVPARNIPIAPPDLFEWVPTSSGENPNFSTPSLETALRILVRINEEGIVYREPEISM